MALPPLTPEQRAEALDKAAAARRERAAVKNRLKNARGSLAAVLHEGRDNDAIGKMKVIALLDGSRPVRSWMRWASLRAVACAGWDPTRWLRSSSAFRRRDDRPLDGARGTHGCG